MAKKYLDENGLLYYHQKVKSWLGGKVDKADGKGLSTNDYTTEEKNKLAGLENYSLPTASAETLGGVKVGAGLTVNNGVLSATGGGTADSVDWGNIVNNPTGDLNDLQTTDKTSIVNAINELYGKDTVVIDGSDSNEIMRTKLLSVLDENSKIIKNAIFISGSTLANFIGIETVESGKKFKFTSIRLTDVNGYKTSYNYEIYITVPNDETSELVMETNYDFFPDMETMQSMYGNPSDLATTDKTNLVNAINEVYGGAAVVISDTEEDETIKTKLLSAVDSNYKIIKPAFLISDGVMLFVLADVDTATGGRQFRFKAGNLMDMDGQNTLYSVEILYTISDTGELTKGYKAGMFLDNEATIETINQTVADAIGDIQGIEYSIVTELPTTGEAGIIYLINNNGSNPNIYDEYIWVTDKFEKIGTTETDLTGYVKTDDIVAITNSEIDTICA